ncbi:MAG: hypothetical protein KJ799_16695 [Bacteroidetes bacterium]|nr:hypothetical protein [Bacteroidota bacterium]MBU2508337.1 hypothetical protein [Bacteroidota bacterium]
MKQIAFILLLWLVFVASDIFAQHHGGGKVFNDNRKDPSIAALLSIQPMPVDLGNFYTGNWGRGILYTTAEFALIIPAAVLLGRNGWGWGMHNYSNYYGTDDRPSWTTTERNQFYYLLTGYVIVKIISAFDAGYSAERYNQQLSLLYDTKTNAAMLSLSIPFNY